MTAYIDQGDVEADLTPATLVALYDDANRGGPDWAAVTRNMVRACGRVDAFLATEYPGPFPLTFASTAAVPSQIKSAALQWFRAYSFARSVEYVKEYGDREFKRAQEECELLREGKNLIQQLAPKPANVGGVIYDDSHRMVISGADGTNNNTLL